MGTQIWAHSTIRRNPKTNKLGVRTRLYQHPSFSKASKARNRISPGSSKQTAAVYKYHRAQFGHRTATYALTAAGGTGLAFPIIRGIKARRILRPTGIRRSAILGAQRYQVRSHGTRPVVHHPLNRHLRANHLVHGHTAQHRGGRRNVRVRRGAHGHFAGSY